MRPLKLSQKPFCIGFPGAMKCQTTLLSCAQANMAFEVNSVPLSETIMPGLPRRLINAVSSRAPRRPDCLEALVQLYLTLPLFGELCFALGRFRRDEGGGQNQGEQ